MATNGLTDVKSEDQPHQDREEFKKLAEIGLPPSVCNALCDMFSAGIVEYNDLETKTLEVLKTIPAEGVQKFFEQFKQANLTGVQNTGAYLGLNIKMLSERIKQTGLAGALNVPVFRAPQQDVQLALLSRTGYPLEVTMGQRKYGPPDNWPGDVPGKGCELYVGQMPKEWFETDLLDMFEPLGTVYDIRLMMEPSTGFNKTYGFVSFATKDMAAKASKEFDGKEFNGKKLKCNVSIPNTRLFIGNIPKSKTASEIREEFEKFTEGIREVIIYGLPDKGADRINRGFCFIDFEDHKSAANCKRSLGQAKTRPWNRELIPDWADPVSEADDDKMKEVKVLYVRNLCADITEEQVRAKFAPFGEIEKTKRMKDYAFVHFVERPDALKAMEGLQGHEFSPGTPCEVKLAKPMIDSRAYEEQRRQREQRQGLGPRRQMGGRGGGFGGGYGDGYGGGYGMRGGRGFGGGGRGFGGGMPRGRGFGGGMGRGGRGMGAMGGIGAMAAGYGGGWAAAAGYGGGWGDGYGYGAGGAYGAGDYGAGYGYEDYGYGYEDDSYGYGGWGGAGAGAMRGAGGMKRKADGAAPGRGLFGPKRMNMGGQ